MARFLPGVPAVTEAPRKPRKEHINKGRRRLVTVTPDPDTPQDSPEGVWGAVIDPGDMVAEFPTELLAMIGGKSSRKGHDRVGKVITVWDKVSIVVRYVETGTLAGAAHSMGVDRSTAFGWTKQDWWLPTLNHVRAAVSQRMTARLSRVADAAMAATEDRLRNGDIHIHRGGHFIAPVNARVAGFIGAMYFDKLRLAQGQPTSLTASLGDLLALRETLSGAAASYRETALQPGGNAGGNPALPALQPGGNEVPGATPNAWQQPTGDA